MPAHVASFTAAGTVVTVVVTSSIVVVVASVTVVVAALVTVVPVELSSEQAPTARAAASTAAPHRRRWRTGVGASSCIRSTAGSRTSGGTPLYGCRCGPETPRAIRPWPRATGTGSVAYMTTGFRADLAARSAALVDQGLFKRERVIASSQSARIRLEDGTEVVNLCANNYLGLADHPALVDAAHRALDRYGYGMASVRFICGTQTVHRELEERIAAFLGMDDAILYSSCFDANTGLFETILDESDAVISDALNHASLIDDIRLCKAARHRYANSDMGELGARLEEARSARYRLIATDGVFSRSEKHTS